MKKTTKAVTDGFLDRETRLSPAERALTVASMCGETTEKQVAVTLGMSLSHVRNFVRLRKKLSPAAWKLFEEQGRSASIRQWIAVCKYEGREQLKAAKVLASGASTKGA